MSGYRLGLNKRKCVSILERLGSQLPELQGVKIEFDLDSSRSVGFGENMLIDSNVLGLTIGSKDLTNDFQFPKPVVPDLAFVRSLVVLYHEYGHYLQNYGERGDVANAISELSVIGNADYYLNMWNQLPHEIDAEHAGVMLAWDFLSATFPDKADDCMFEYLRYRCNNTMYMFPAGSVFQSRNEVAAAFESAKQAALDVPRKLLPRYHKSSDRASELLITNSDYPTESPYYAFFDKLIERMPGRQKDRMMAALVLHLRPEWKYIRQELFGEDLSIKHEFGIPFPESSEVSRQRLGICGVPDSLKYGLLHTRDINKLTCVRDTSDLDRMTDEILQQDAGSDYEYE